MNSPLTKPNRRAGEPGVGGSLPERRGVLLRGKQCQCRGCNQYFRSVTAFEKHRVGTFRPNTRRCLTVAEMQASGMELRGSFWVSEAYEKPPVGDRPTGGSDRALSTDRCR